MLDRSNGVSDRPSRLGNKSNYNSSAITDIQQGKQCDWTAQATIKRGAILGRQVVCGDPCDQRTLGTTVAPMDVTRHCNESPDMDFILPNGLAVHGAVPPLARWKQIALRSVWPDPIQFCKVAPNAMDLESSLVLIGAEVWLVGSGWATKQADSWDTFLNGVDKWNYDDGRITLQ
eukprot:TRINITY_DN67322_c4_g1_i19.p1 TRINITY_DN67322_c4_g1~~TRINITY_DN67322_c4_g1_i19.p1  ORF type:complete len:175 (+),score=11.45 TRINITY_DN67322_c4_g1_i19:289-813(+)